MAMKFWQRVKFALSDDGGASRAPDDDFWYNPVGGFWGALSPREALQVSAVDACVRVLSETVASLPLHVYERNATGGRDVARDHATYDVLHSMPNEYQTAFDFWEYVMRQVLTYGASLSILAVDAKNNVSSITPVCWSRVTMDRDRQTGIRVFRVRTNDRLEGDYVDSEVLFIPGPHSTPTEVRSILDVHAASIGLSIHAQTYVRNYFHKGATGPIYASFPQDMGVSKLNEWSDWLRKKFAGSANSGSIPVMPMGGKLENVPIKHTEMQLVELRRFQIEEIARAFRVPPHLIQDLSRSTNNNIEHQSLDFAMHAIRPWLERLEARINASVYGPRERQRVYAEFDMEGLLRGDSQGRAAIMGATVGNGVMTPNEWRDRMNLNRRPEADRLMIQGAMVPLEMAGQQQEQQGVAQ